MFYVYKYYINNELVYIGKTLVGPYERYRQHVLEESRYNKITDFEVMEVDTEIDMDILESYFIAMETPPWNIKDTDKSRPKISITYPYEFKHYSYSEFCRLFGFGKTKSPISRNRMKELMGRPRIRDFTLNDLIENQCYCGKNRGFEVKVPQWFCDEIQKFMMDENPDIKLPSTDCNVINYRVEVEDLSTGLKESVYPVEYVHWVDDNLYAQCITLDEFIKLINSL